VALTFLHFSLHAVKDKANHAVILDKATSEKLYKDVQSYRLITVATLVDRLKINGSLARKALADLEEKGQIKKVVGHSKMNIYSMLCLIFILLYEPWLICISPWSGNWCHGFEQILIILFISSGRDRSINNTFSYFTMRRSCLRICYKFDELSSMKMSMTTRFGL
jgi:small subunit ribosomal protein S25e